MWLFNYWLLCIWMIWCNSSSRYRCSLHFFFKLKIIIQFQFLYLYKVNNCQIMIIFVININIFSKYHIKFRNYKQISHSLDIPIAYIFFIFILIGYQIDKCLRYEIQIYRLHYKMIKKGIKNFKFLSFVKLSYFFEYYLNNLSYCFDISFNFALLRHLVLLFTILYNSRIF